MIRPYRRINDNFSMIYATTDMSLAQIILLDYCYLWIPRLSNINMHTDLNTEWGYHRDYQSHYD